MLRIVRRAGAGFGLTILMLSGCASAPERVQVQVGAYYGLVFSNFPVRRDMPEPTATLDGLSIPYALIVQNEGSTPAYVHLSQARLEPESSDNRARCTAADRSAETLTVARGERARIDCSLFFGRRITEKVAHSDVMTELGLPVRAGNADRVLRFQYLLLAGDAR